MISQDLNSEINIKDENCIHSKKELINISKFGKLSKNHSFIVETCFEHTLIHILKGEYLEKKDMKTILEYHPLFENLNSTLN